MFTSMAELANTKPSVTDYTVNGSCSGCGACCSDFLPVSREEVKRIRAYVRSHHLREHTSKVAAGDFMDATCPFRDDVHRKCDIYEVRPQICRCFQCNQDMETIRLNRDELHRKNGSHSMRAEFFGNEQNALFARMIEAAQALM